MRQLASLAAAIYCERLQLSFGVMPHEHDPPEFQLTRTDSPLLFRWFARLGDQYRDAYLSHIDVNRLSTDARYGLKLFLFSWAFERAGAPRSYRIAAVKAIGSLDESQRDLRRIFGRFCHGKKNPRGNPMMDPRVNSLDIPRVTSLVQQGSLEDAFRLLRLKGVRHKLRSFFLRDLVTLLDAHAKVTGLEQNLWCQPVDVWVRMAASHVCRGRKLNHKLPDHRRYDLSSTDMSVACQIVSASLVAEVSPLRVNQGIWHFCANAVSDEIRLADLLRAGKPELLDRELELMHGFLPVRPPWGSPVSAA